MRCARSIVVLAVVAIGCKQAATPAPTAQPPTPVRTVAVEREVRARPVYATGVLANKAEVRASFKVGGLVAQVLVDEGDTVKKGQVLARLNMTEIEAGVRQVRQSQAKAFRDLRRVEKLYAGDAATKEQLEDARTAAAVTSAQVKAAQFNQDHAVIKALTDGRVLRRLSEAGEVVGVGQPVFVLSSDRAGWVVRVGLADRDVVRVAAGDAATLELAALPGVTLKASVEEIASAATPPLGTFEVELHVEVPPELPPLLSGLIASARIDPRPAAGAQVAMIPASALRDGNGKTAAVWVPDGETGGVVRREVTIGFFDGDRVAVTAGLEGVAAVITDGAAYLGPNSKITLAGDVADAPAKPDEASPLEGP